MKFLFLLAYMLVCTPDGNLQARGGGGFHGGMEGGEWRGGQEGLEVDSGRDSLGDPEDGLGGVNDDNVRTDGRGESENVMGFEGYRSGYIWRDGEYVPVSCDPWIPYVVPFGMWEGWSVVTQPDYLQYPAYASCPIETAVQVSLKNIGLYDGPVEGVEGDCEEAIREYQSQNGLPVTGTITPELLRTLGVQAAAP